MVLNAVNLAVVFEGSLLRTGGVFSMAALAPAGFCHRESYTRRVES